jgi:hypothetical protein
MSLKKFNKFNESFIFPNVDDMTVTSPEDMINLLKISKQIKYKLESSRNEFIEKEKQEVDDRLLALSEDYNIPLRVRTGPSGNEKIYITTELNYGHLRLSDEPNFLKYLSNVIIRLYDRYKFISITFDNEYGGTPRRLDIPIDSPNTDEQNVKEIEKYITDSNEDNSTSSNPYSCWPKWNGNYRVRIKFQFVI